MINEKLSCSGTLPKKEPLCFLEPFVKDPLCNACEMGCNSQSDITQIILHANHESRSLLLYALGDGPLEQWKQYFSEVTSKN